MSLLLFVENLVALSCSSFLPLQLLKSPTNLLQLREYRRQTLQIYCTSHWHSDFHWESMFGHSLELVGVFSTLPYALTLLSNSLFPTLTKLTLGYSRTPLHRSRNPLPRRSHFHSPNTILYLRRSSRLRSLPRSTQRLHHPRRRH